MKRKIFSTSTSMLIFLSLGSFQISNAMNKQSIQQVKPAVQIEVKSTAEEVLEAQRDAEAAEAAAQRALEAEGKIDIFSGVYKAREAAALAIASAGKARKAATFAADAADLAKGHQELAARKAAEEPPKQLSIFASAAEEDDFYDNY